MRGPPTQKTITPELMAWGEAERRLRAEELLAEREAATRGPRARVSYVADMTVARRARSRAMGLSPSDAGRVLAAVERLLGVPKKPFQRMRAEQWR